MKICVTAILFLTLVIFGTRCSKSDPNDSIFGEYQFPGHSGLKHLCQQRVYGSGHEIHWNAFASDATPSELVNYYRQKLGDAGFEKEGEGGTWRLPADAPQPARVLEIMPTGTEAPYRSCDKSPPASARSIVMVSKMY